jgi:Flp pilus assembly protein TadD
MPNLAIERMQLGHAARRAGRTAEALDHYRSAAAQEPGSAEAHSVYGLMLLQLGRADEAEAPLRKAVEIAPRHPALRMNLAQWLAHQGKIDDAVHVVARIVEDEPQHWWAWERLGELKARQRKFGEAAAHFERASELKPQDPSLLFKRAQSCFDDGRHVEAERIRAEAESLARTSIAVLRQHAEFHQARANWAGLEKVANAWIAVNSRDPAAWRSLATAQWETGYFGRAMEAFRHALTLGVRDAQSLATYGGLCMSALEFDVAAKALDEAEALDPNCTPMLSAKASLLMVSGRYDEAQSYCRRALEKNRSDVSAYKTLVQLTSGLLSKVELADLESLVNREDLRLVDRVTGAFALADCYEAQETGAEAFAAYDRANVLARESGGAEGIYYDAVARKARTDELISLCDSVPERPARDSELRIVFVVGMPRSGTTLVESVIGAHSKVFACGERMAIRWVIEEFLSRARAAGITQIDAGTWDEWRKLFWQGIPLEHGASVVTDKNPWNFDATGVILRLFPDARVIHVRRNPMDTGLSIYRNQFSKGMQFANRLEDIGHYYGEYARLMAHWDRVAAGRFATIQYEEMIRDFDTAGPALLAACGLDWEPGCRRFWESRRVISTMSTMQARRPLETRAGRAEKYATELKPLADSLRAAGVDLTTGALRTES